MPQPLRRAAILMGLAATLAVSLAGCSLLFPALPVHRPTFAPPVQGPLYPIAVFDVNGETFRIELITAEHLQHAKALLAGSTDAPIPSGLIVRGDPGVNAPWSWHIDPATLEWADVTTEVCDGLPSQIEDGSFTFDRFCPWSALVTGIEGIQVIN